MSAPVGLNDNEMLLMEVTGVTATEARNLLAAFEGNIDNAVAAFFEHPESYELRKGGRGGSKTGTPPPTGVGEEGNAGLYTPPPLSMVGADGNSRFNKAESCKLGAPLPPIVAHLAYGAPTEIAGLHAEDTVQTLKAFIAEASKVPVVVQKIIWNGGCLLDGSKTLKSVGIATAKGSAEIAVLFPNRDDRGSVSVVSTAPDGTSKVLFELKEGEWSVSTSVRDVRKRAMEAMKNPKGQYILVHNALRLENESTFAQNGIRKGSVISILDDSRNRAEYAKR